MELEVSAEAGEFYSTTQAQDRLLLADAAVAVAEHLTSGEALPPQ